MIYCYLFQLTASVLKTEEEEERKNQRSRPTKGSKEGLFSYSTLSSLVTEFESRFWAILNNVRNSVQVDKSPQQQTSGYDTMTISVLVVGLPSRINTRGVTEYVQLYFDKDCVCDSVCVCVCVCVCV